MRLVDNEQRDATFPQKVAILRIFQALGGHVNQSMISLRDAVTRFALFRCRKGRVQFRTLNFRFLGFLHLILHKGYQGRHDHCCFGEQQRRKLEGQRFPASCRHDSEDVLTGEHRLNDLPLARTKMIYSETLRLGA